MVNRRPCCWTSVSHRDHSARVHHASCVVTKEGPCTWLSHCVCRWFSASSITDVFWWWLTYDAEIFTLCMLPCVSPRPLHQIALSLIFQPFSFQASNWMVKPLATSRSHVFNKRSHFGPLFPHQVKCPALLFHPLEKCSFSPVNVSAVT